MKSAISNLAHQHDPTLNPHEKKERGVEQVWRRIIGHPGFYRRHRCLDLLLSATCTDRANTQLGDACFPTWFYYCPRGVGLRFRHCHRFFDLLTVEKGKPCLGDTYIDDNCRIYLIIAGLVSTMMKKAPNNSRIPMGIIFPISHQLQSHARPRVR